MQAQTALADPLARRPVLIRLGELSRYAGIEGLLGGMFTFDFPVDGFNVRRFLDLNAKGRLLIVLDGFDEMKHAMSWADFRHQIADLNRFTGAAARSCCSGVPAPSPRPTSISMSCAASRNGMAAIAGCPTGRISSNMSSRSSPEKSGRASSPAILRIARRTALMPRPAIATGSPGGSRKSTGSPTPIPTCSASRSTPKFWSTWRPTRRSISPASLTASRAGALRSLLPIARRARVRKGGAASDRRNRASRLPA